MSEDTARGAWYIRTSTTDRVHQLQRLLRNYAAASVGGHLCEVFTAFGGCRRRPGLDTAFAVAQTGRFDVLLVHSVLELTGAPRLGPIVERFRTASVTVRSLAEQFASTGWHGAFFVDVIDARRAMHQAAPAGDAP